MAVVSSIADPHAVFRYTDILSNALIGLCGSLAPEALNSLLSQVELVQLDVGETLYRQGDFGETMHVVLTGRLEIRVRREDGEERVLAYPQPGEVVGEIALLAGSPRAATVVAVRDTLLGALQRSALEALVTEDPSVFSRVARMIITRLTGGQGHIACRPGARTIALVPLHDSLDREGFGRDLRNALLRFGSVLHLDSRSAAIRCSAQGEPDYGRLLDDCERAFDYLILEGDSRPSHWSRRCYGYADHILLIADASCPPASTELERWLREQGSGNGGRADVALVLVHPSGATPKATREWLAERDVARHYHVVMDDKPGMARLARFLTGNAVALVLAGGGARGFAHLGVIRALREFGVPIDAVGGSSFGALAATGLARDLEDEQILDEQHFAFTRDDPLSDYTVPIVSLIRGQRLNHILRRHLPMDIEDLWLPFFAVSSDLSANQMRVHERGALWEAIRASVSLPGILPPALEQGHLLIDGAVLNNLPVDIMRERVRGKVIAVNLAVEKEFTLDQEEVPRAWDYLTSRLMPWRQPVDAPTISRVILKATTLASQKELGNARKLADFYLNPPVGGFDFLDWGRLREIVDVGYTYALPRVAEWVQAHPRLQDRYRFSRGWRSMY